MISPALAAYLAAEAEHHKEQVSDHLFLLDLFYTMATVCLVLIVAAVGLIDGGLVRRKNSLDNWIQKIIAALIAAGAMWLIGYSIWNIQFYQAFGVPDPIKQAIQDWWGFGTNATTFSQKLDFATVPEADVFQIFMVFFMAYAAVGGTLLHSAGLERVKAAPMYIISAIAGGIVIPIALYYTWGSLSPLTNRGVHDYIGVYSLYIVVGVWALIIAWRAGPRLGAFERHELTTGPLPHNFGFPGLGVGLLLFAAPFAFLGCGYWVGDAGYFGISMTESGFGIALLNIFVAYIGGGLAGAVISYRTKNSLMALIGVAAGYIGAGASLDIAKPWQIFIISFISTFVVYGVYNLLQYLRIDDRKIVPLALGGGAYGALVAGIVGSGDKTGGFFGLKGEYAFQGAEISFGWQLIGLGATVAFALVTGLIVIVGLEKTIGLRVTDVDEIRGLDETYWQTPVPPYHDTPLNAEVSMSGNQRSVEALD